MYKVKQIFIRFDSFKFVHKNINFINIRELLIIL